jgi:hypothetical protein
LLALRWSPVLRACELRMFEKFANSYHFVLERRVQIVEPNIRYQRVSRAIEMFGAVAFRKAPGWRLPGP